MDSRRSRHSRHNGFPLKFTKKGDEKYFEDKVKSLMKAGIDMEVPVFIVISDLHEYFAYQEILDKMMKIMEKATTYSKVISDEVEVDINYVLITHKPFMFDSEFMKRFLSVKL